MKYILVLTSILFLTVNFCLAEGNKANQGDPLKKKDIKIKYPPKIAVDAPGRNVNIHYKDGLKVEDQTSTLQTPKAEAPRRVTTPKAGKPRER